MAASPSNTAQVSGVYPRPSDENHFLADHVRLLCQSFRTFTGGDLVKPETSGKDMASALFHAPVIVLSHNTDNDPILTYCNLAGLNLFELSWEEMVCMPSRLTAEAMEREERARLLERVSKNGFIDDYAGIRISKNGRRFRIEQATVWNLVDEKGEYRGQAATFTHWTFV